MKKIIFIHLFNDRSGSPAILARVIEAVKAAGYEADLYTGRQLQEGVLSGMLETHHYIPYQWVKNKYLHFIFYCFSQLILFFQLLKYRNQNVLIYVNTLMPFGAGLAGKVMGQEVFYHLHETSFRPRWLKNFLRFVIQATASKIIFVSDYLLLREGFKNKKQVCVLNSLPNAFFKEAAEHVYHPGKDGFFNVLMICSLKKYKGVSEFLMIAGRCGRNPHVQFELVLNASSDEVKDFFSGRILPPNLRVVPRQTELFQFYKKASLVLNLSRVDEWVETFGLTILEAMAFGIPVIVPPVGGPAEIVQDGREGYLISSYETEKIVSVISELAASNERCLELSQNAKKRAANFSYASFEKNILKEIANA